MGKLQVAWSFPTGTPEQFEVSPVVHDGIMYVTTSNNRLLALDAATGELYWRYDHPLPGDLRVCCGIVNRGVAISGDLVRDRLERGDRPLRRRLQRDRSAADRQ